MVRARTILPLLLACAAFAQGPDPIFLVGYWIGSGVFENAKFREEHGTLPFELNIDPDLVLTGKVGEARIQPCEPNHEEHRFSYTATLHGEIQPSKALQKNTLVLVLLAADARDLRAEFHLKSGTKWDWSVRNGILEALKKDPQDEDPARPKPSEPSEPPIPPSAPATPPSTTAP